jgi:uncharacterized protein YndB with AHSA1/START domain
MPSDAIAQTAATKSIVVELELRHPPEKVWRALTESDLIAAWLMPNDFRAQVGHRFTMRTRPAPGFDGIVQCEVLAVEPNRRLSYSWRGGAKDRQGYGALLDTVVTWTLTPGADGGTRLHLEHKGFGAAQESTFNILKQGWSVNVAERLNRVLEAMA